jgi:hypothetical protein
MKLSGLFFYMNRDIRFDLISWHSGEGMILLAPGFHRLIHPVDPKSAWRQMFGGLSTEDFGKFFFFSGSHLVWLWSPGDAPNLWKRIRESTMWMYWIAPARKKHQHHHMMWHYHVVKIRLLLRLWAYVVLTVTKVLFSSYMNLSAGRIHYSLTLISWDFFHHGHVALVWLIDSDSLNKIKYTTVMSSTHRRPGRACTYYHPTLHVCSATKLIPPLCTWFETTTWPCLRRLCACMYQYMYVCISICIWDNNVTLSATIVCTYVWVYVYVCIYVWVFDNYVTSPATMCVYIYQKGCRIYVSKGIYE